MSSQCFGKRRRRAARTGRVKTKSPNAPPRITKIFCSGTLSKLVMDVIYDGCGDGERRGRRNSTRMGGPNPIALFHVEKSTVHKLSGNDNSRIVCSIPTDGVKQKLTIVRTTIMQRLAVDKVMRKFINESRRQKVKCWDILHGPDDNAPRHMQRAPYRETIGRTQIFASNEKRFQ